MMPPRLRPREPETRMGGTVPPPRSAGRSFGAAEGEGRRRFNHLTGACMSVGRRTERAHAPAVATRSPAAAGMLGVEARRWSYLRRRQLGEHKFRHQALIGPFVADFVYLAARLMGGPSATLRRLAPAPPQRVGRRQEVDGPAHDTRWGPEPRHLDHLGIGRVRARGTMSPAPGPRTEGIRREALPS
jgi:hypothetical protein